jgi:predicted NAD/FAD-dependent oxidoreductase
MKIAIAGAGMSGVSAALTLKEAGHRVVLFEKSRGPSGRMSTRRDQDWQADHGAQYFTAKSPAFSAQVQAWCQRGIAAEWLGRIDNPGPRRAIQRFVGTPRMSSLVAALSAELDLHTGLTLCDVQRAGQGWRLGFKEQAEHWSELFDALILSMPSPQLLPFETHFPADWSSIIAATQFAPCWSVMVGYTQGIDLPFDARFMDGDPVLSWLARNHSKQGRSGPETWTLHASPAYSEAHLEDPAENVIQACLAAFAALGAPAPTWVQAHRWRYALPSNPLAPNLPALWDRTHQLGLCGDWLAGGRVEGAWLSGKTCAEQLLKTA